MKGAIRIHSQSLWVVVLSVAGGIIVGGEGFQPIPVGAQTVGIDGPSEDNQPSVAENRDCKDLNTTGERDADCPDLAIGAEDGRSKPEEIAREGILRIGNRTPYPLRVVLHRRSGIDSSDIPAHWDFAPGEGGSAGLIMSLKEREPLVVRPGDVIVAFAIDGSRRYWGPNVVSETVAPFWNESDRSWTMILQP